jgi:3-isopropylmalate/(R)-2-methylmalate dehydratase large subunit
MGLTIIEKILAAHCGQKAVEPGEFVRARVDMAMGNDLSAAGAVGVFGKIGARRVWDPEKVAVIFDHIVPANAIAAANLLGAVRRFVREQGIAHFYDEGRNGIAHIIMTGQGLCGPGDLVIGGDSHTCTYALWAAFRRALAIPTWPACGRWARCGSRCRRP